MSANKAGSAIWRYYDDYYQMEMYWSSDPEDAWECYQAIRDYEIEQTIERFEKWSDDFGEEHGDEDE